MGAALQAWNLMRPSWLWSSWSRRKCVPVHLASSCRRTRMKFSFFSIMTQVPNMPSSDIRQVCGGGAHTLVVTNNSELLSCGLGAEGQLGQGDWSTFILILPCLFRFFICIHICKQKEGIYTRFICIHICTCMYVYIHACEST
jgi:hypothetical protein